MAKTIAVVGASGDMGGRIIDALLAQPAPLRPTVRAIVRPTSKRDSLAEREKAGAEVHAVDPNDVAALTKAFEGVTTVISTVQGLRDVIVDTQGRMLDAAIAAGVAQFIPSDFSIDFTSLPEGENRNGDLRREFHQRFASANIRATSIWNGAFAEMLQYGMPILDFRAKTIGYIENADQPLGFTTKDNTAAFTAAAALDAEAPRSLHCASFRITPNELVALASELSGTPYQLVKMGSLADASAYNKQQRAAHPEGENELFPRWQQAQYMHNMFAVPAAPLDNVRYNGIEWTSAHDFIAPLVKPQQ